MKDLALALARETEDPGRKLNVLREYVQAFVMRSFSESEAFQCLSFVGGTALRFLFGLPRFSEDLDFSLEQSSGYSPVKWLEKLKRDLGLSGFKPTVTWNERKTVLVAWVRVAELLEEAKLVPVRNQNLSIKLEIDSRPPAGADLTRQVINHHMPFAVQHHDLPSLMAGKVHALLTAPYPKGRDWYDLLWYRSQRPIVEPNLGLLQNALDQTHPGEYTTKKWQEALHTRLSDFNGDQILSDVRQFLERPGDAHLLTKSNFQQIIGSASG